MEPWAVFTLAAIATVLGFWSGWMFAMGQVAMKLKGTDLHGLRERSDEASPDTLQEDHFGVRLLPREHLTAITHARANVLDGGDWTCNCPTCFKVRAAFAERGRLTIYTQSIMKRATEGR